MNSRARKVVAQELEGFLAGPEAVKFRGFALMLCQNHEAQAEELEQEACRRALAKAALYDPARPFMTWVMSILHNSAMDLLRSAAYKSVVSLDAEIPGLGLPYSEALEDGCRSIPDFLEKQETVEQVRRAIERLPATYREIITLCDIDEVSYKDAARRLRLPLGTVRSRLARARAALCRLLKSYR